jgi:hypothetical protein
MSKTVFSSLILSALLLACPILNAQDEPIAQAVPDSPKPAAAPGEAQSKPTVRPITVSVSLVDDTTTITGTLTETTSLSIKTAFGIAELPLNEVAGVRFPRGDDTSTTVVMLNGDSITGATDLKFATVETSWGSAKINGQSIASMMMVPGLAWQSVDVLGSKRWQLIEAPRSTNQPGKLGNTQLGQPSSGTVLPGTSSSPAGTALPRTSGQPLPAPSPPRIGN